MHRIARTSLFASLILLLGLGGVAPARAAVNCVTGTGHAGDQLTAQIYSCGYPNDLNYHIRLDISGPQSWPALYDGEGPAGTWSETVTASKAGTYTFTFTEDSYGSHYVTTAQSTLLPDDVQSAPTTVPQSTSSPEAIPTPFPVATPRATSAPIAVGPVPVATTPKPTPAPFVATPSPTLPEPAPTLTSEPIDSPGPTITATPTPSASAASVSSASPSVLLAIKNANASNQPDSRSSLVGGLFLLVWPSFGLLWLRARQRRRDRP